MISNEPSKQPAKKEINPFFLSLSIFVTLDIVLTTAKIRQKEFKKLLKRCERTPAEPLLTHPRRAASGWTGSGCVPRPAEPQTAKFGMFACSI